MATKGRGSYFASRFFVAVLLAPGTVWPLTPACCLIKWINFCATKSTFGYWNQTSVVVSCFTTQKCLMLDNSLPLSLSFLICKYCNLSIPLMEEEYKIIYLKHQASTSAKYCCHWWHSASWNTYTVLGWSRQGKLGHLLWFGYGLSTSPEECCVEM